MYSNQIIHIPFYDLSRNKFGFTFQDVAREFPEKNCVHLAKIMGHPKTLKSRTYNADYLRLKESPGKE